LWYADFCGKVISVANITQTRIFISSTYTDLSAIRATVVQWLAGVFGADLLIMETFGSEAAPPEVGSVRRVRDCDLFVGIYAHRYGTVDQSTGKSIAELELDEAERAFSSGVLTGILLYIVDNNVPWPNQHRETGQIAKAGLKRLKQKALRHTVTFFKGGEDLLFLISRDVYKGLAERIGTSPLKVRPSVLPSPRTIHQPVGMEFIASENRYYLVGREQTVREMLTRLDDDHVVLLLGDSGVGKTSLIHAGLIPEVVDQGWRVIYTRPLGCPCTDIVSQIQASVFEARPLYRGSLLNLLAEVAAAISEEKELLIIDQFEDILLAREDREVSSLTSQLRIIRELAIPSVYILISYRSDLEGRLGTYWQEISGSPHGLSRVYLSGINIDEAWQGVVRAAQDLLVNLKLRPYEERRIRNDLLASGSVMGLCGVYPPYLQMLVDHIWSSSKKASGTYTFKHYQESGGMDGVLGGYLSRLLEYAQDKEGDARLVLVSLVRSYGVKAQRSINEIAADTGLNGLACESALERLIDLRLVRHIGDYYEISHDFIAKQIIHTLVDSEERVFKRFRELLATKAAAYQTTGATLTCEELLMLYKYKERITPNEQEMRLLLSSWIQERGPALYWLLNAARAKLLEWLRAEESKETIVREAKISIVLLRRKLGESPVTDEDYLALRNYRLSAELASLILENPISVPDKLITNGLRHRREEVREACLEAVVAKIRNGDWDWIRRLQSSSSASCRDAYRTIVLRNDIPIPKTIAPRDRALQLFTLLKTIISASNNSDSMAAYESLSRMRPALWVKIFSRALTRIRTHKMTSVLGEAKRASTTEARLLLAAIGSKVAPLDFDSLVTSYEDWNSRERGRYRRNAWCVKASALSETIARSSSVKHLPRLRDAIMAIRLTTSSRDVVLALLKYGNENDLKLVLDRIAAEEQRIVYWNHAGLGRTASKQLVKSTRKMPKFLKEISARTEFWEYIPDGERRTHEIKDLLSIKSVDNRGLYIRLAAFGMIGLAKKEDMELLLQLTRHNYSLIASSAAKRIVNLTGESALRSLSAGIDESIARGGARSLAEALRSAEVELFGIVALWQNEDIGAVGPRNSGFRS